LLDVAAVELSSRACAKNRRAGSRSRADLKPVSPRHRVARGIFSGCMLQPWSDTNRLTEKAPAAIPRSQSLCATPGTGAPLTGPGGTGPACSIRTGLGKPARIQHRGRTTFQWVSYHPSPLKGGRVCMTPARHLPRESGSEQVQQIGLNPPPRRAVDS